jgi:ferric iron reductase protein FhuF
MLQVEEFTTISEVQKLVEEKKQQMYKDCVFYAILPDGKKVPIWEDVTLGNFKTIEKILMGIFQMI